MCHDQVHCFSPLGFADARPDHCCPLWVACGTAEVGPLDSRENVRCRWRLADRPMDVQHWVHVCRSRSSSRWTTVRWGLVGGCWCRRTRDLPGGVVSCGRLARVVRGFLAGEIDGPVSKHGLLAAWNDFDITQDCRALRRDRRVGVCSINRAKPQTRSTIYLHTTDGAILWIWQRRGWAHILLVPFVSDADALSVAVPQSPSISGRVKPVRRHEHGVPRQSSPSLELGSWNARPDRQKPYR
jgi:hypothetical protein